MFVRFCLFGFLENKLSFVVLQKLGYFFFCLLAAVMTMHINDLVDAPKRLVTWRKEITENAMFSIDSALMSSSSGDNEVHVHK